MFYSYVVSVQKPTLVSASLKGNFTSPTDINVLLVKPRDLEILTYNDEESLEKTYSFEFFSKILICELFRPSMSNTDYLFLLTEKLEFSIVHFDEDNETLTTVAFGDFFVKERQRDCVAPLISIDPSNRFIALHIYRGDIIVIQLNERGELLAGTLPRLVPLYELGVLSICFTHSRPKPKSSFAITDRSLGTALAASDTGSTVSGASLSGVPPPPKKAPPPPSLSGEESTSQLSSMLGRFAPKRSSDVDRKDEDSSTIATLSSMDSSAAGVAYSLRSLRLLDHPSDGTQNVQLPFVIVYRDSEDQRHVRGYILNMLKLELEDYSKWDLLRVEDGCHSVIAVPPPCCGVLLMGQYSVVYRNEDNCQRRQIPDGAYEAWCTTDVDLSSVLDERYPGTSMTGAMSSILDDSSSAIPGPARGTRYLIGDCVNKSLLYLCLLHNSDFVVTGMQFDVAGPIVSPTSLCYLTDGVAFIGSAAGDHQMVRIHEDKYWPSRQEEEDEDDEDDDPGMGMDVGMSEPREELEASDTLVEVLQEFTNCAPIVDMVAVDLEKQGQSQVVCCSGQGRDGSLRIVRNGVSIDETAQIEMPGMQGIWSLAESNVISKDEEMMMGSSSKYDKYLIESFATETRVLSVGEEGLSEITMEGLQKDERSVYLHNMNLNTFVQATVSGVRLISIIEPFELLDSWDSSSTINSACSNRFQILVAMAGGNISLIQVVSEQDGSDGDIEGGGLDDEDEEEAVGSGSKSTSLKLREVNSTRMENDISCVNISPTSDYESEARFCAVGLWKEHSVMFLSLPDFKVFFQLPLSVTSVPRSVLVTTFISPRMKHDSDGDDSGDEMGLGMDVEMKDESTKQMAMKKKDDDCRYFMFVGMGDGSLVECGLQLKYHDSSMICNVMDQKLVPLGSHPVVLTPFVSSNEFFVFAGCDTPTILHRTRGGRIQYSSVSVGSVTHMCSFNAEDYPDNLALSVDSSDLLIGTMDDMQTLQVLKVPLNEQPRRIAYNSQYGCYLVATEAPTEYPLDMLEKKHTKDVDSGEEETTMNEPVISDSKNTFLPHFNQKISRMHLVNDQTFSPLQTKNLKPYWSVTRIVAQEFPVCVNESGLVGDSASMMGDSSKSKSNTRMEQFFIVGSALAYPNEPDVRKGKLQVYCLSTDLLQGRAVGPSASSSSSSESTKMKRSGDIALDGLDDGLDGGLDGDDIDMMGGGLDSSSSLAATVGGIGHSAADLARSYSSASAMSKGGNHQASSSSSSSSTMTKVCEHVFFKGAPRAFACLGTDHLVVGIKNKLVLFHWTLARKSDEKVSSFPYVLEHVYTVPGLIQIIDIKTHGDFFIVGDLMKSVALYLFNRVKKTIEEVARDCAPTWLTCCDMLDDQFMFAADRRHNLFGLARNLDATDTETRARLEICSRFHIGTQINCILRGSMVAQTLDDGRSSVMSPLMKETSSSGPRRTLTEKSSDTALISMTLERSPSLPVTAASSSTSGDSSSVTGPSSSLREADAIGAGSSSSSSPTTMITPLKRDEVRQFLFGTIDGGIGALITIPRERFNILNKVETVLTERLPAIGGFGHDKFREYRSIDQMNFHTSVGFLDGDIVERFLDLPTSIQQSIADEVRMDCSAIVAAIEEMMRLHS